MAPKFRKFGPIIKYIFDLVVLKETSRSLKIWPFFGNPLSSFSLSVFFCLVLISPCFVPLCSISLLCLSAGKGNTKGGWGDGGVELIFGAAVADYAQKFVLGKRFIRGGVDHSTRIHEGPHRQECAFNSQSHLCYLEEGVLTREGRGADLYDGGIVGWDAGLRGTERRKGRRLPDTLWHSSSRHHKCVGPLPESSSPKLISSFFFKIHPFKFISESRRFFILNDIAAGGDAIQKKQTILRNPIIFLFRKKNSCFQFLQIFRFGLVITSEDVLLPRESFQASMADRIYIPLFYLSVVIVFFLPKVFSGIQSVCPG